MAQPKGSLKLNVGDMSPAVEATRDVAAMRKDAQKALEEKPVKSGRMTRISLDGKGLPPGLGEILSTWDNDGDGTVDLVELQAAAELYQMHKNQAGKYKKMTIALLGVVVALLVMMFVTSYVSNEMSKEMHAKNGVMSAAGGNAIVQTATAQAALGLRFASVMDMHHLKNINEVSYILDTGSGLARAKSVSEQVTSVSQEMTEQDGADWPVVTFTTAQGNRVVVDPLDLHLITPDGTSTKLCAKLKADEQSGLRCNALEIDDPGLVVDFLEKKLEEYVAQTDAGRLLADGARALWDCH